MHVDGWRVVECPSFSSLIALTLTVFVYHGDGSPPWLAEDLPGQHLHLLSLPLGNPVSYIFFFTLVVGVQVSSQVMQLELHCTKSYSDCQDWHPFPLDSQECSIGMSLL